MKPAHGSPAHDRFRHFAAWASEVVASPLAFLLACALVVGWAASGPLFGYSDTWELVINTGTTIVTFLIVFLIQNAQNREAKVTQLKLDELIRAVAAARTGLVGLEHLDDEELAKLEEQFEAIRSQRCPDPAER
jgi:low affinity Fe/Cu permease